MKDTADDIIQISWQAGAFKATLTARLKENGFDITYIDKEGGERKLTLTEDFAW